MPTATKRRASPRTWPAWRISVGDRASVASFTRPATLEDLKTLLRSLNAQGVEYLLIGGYALAAHGYTRATTDIDLLVAPTR